METCDQLIQDVEEYLLQTAKIVQSGEQAAGQREALVRAKQEILERAADEVAKDAENCSCRTSCLICSTRKTEEARLRRMVRALRGAGQPQVSGSTGAAKDGEAT